MLENLFGVRQPYDFVSRIRAGNYLDSLAELTDMGFDPTAFFPVQRDRTLRVINIDAVMIRRDEAERLRATRGIAGRP